MSTTLNRIYNLNDEEIPVICNFAISSAQRDLDQFGAFSPRFTRDYLKEFSTLTTSVADILKPQSELLEQKRITLGIYSTLDSLVDPLNRMTSYLHLTHGTLNITPDAFGIKGLRKNISARNVEKAIDNIHLVLVNIAKFKEPLLAAGLTEELIAKFTNAAASLVADKQKQYEMIAHRRSVVQNNKGLFNELYSRLTDILNVGKTLYKKTDPSKCMEYTLSNLKKRVHHVTKPVVVATPSV